MNFRKISPFCGQILESFPFIAEDFDQMTEYALYCKLKEKVDELRNGVNDLGDDVKEYILKFDALKEYVDNLDLQDEVDNKLNEMAESGELANIIGEYLNSNCILKFSSLEELQEATNIIEGNIVGVFGKDEINDGFVNYYLVTTDTTDIALQDNLYAQYLYNEKIDGSYIINEIEHFEFYVENSLSTIQVFKIPNKDKFGKTIELKHGFSNDITNYTPASETAVHFSNRKNATLVTNASVYTPSSDSPNYNKILGLIIHNGQVVTDTRQYYTENEYKHHYILGLKANGLIYAYEGNTSAQTLIDDGVIESWTGFIPILLNGANNRDNLLAKHNWEAPEYTETEDEIPTANKIYYTLDGTEYIGHYKLTNFTSGITYFEQTAGTRYPRQVIAQNETTKDFYILSTNGKGMTSNLGSTFEEVITILKYVDNSISFAYALDEGGSVESVYKNINYINPTDNQTHYSAHTDGMGYTIRRVPDFIYFQKTAETKKDLDLNDLYNEIEDLKHKLNNLELSANVNNIINTGDAVKVNNYAPESNNTNAIQFSQIQQDNTLKMINSIVSNVTTAPGSINFYDNENSKNMFRFKRDGYIMSIDGSSLVDLAKVFKLPKIVTDIDSIREMSVVFCTGSTTNAPFTDTDTRSNIIITFYTNQNNGQAGQIGLYLGGAPSKIAYRCMTNNATWSAWKYLTLSAS